MAAIFDRLYRRGAGWVALGGTVLSVSAFGVLWRAEWRRDEAEFLRHVAQFQSAVQEHRNQVQDLLLTLRALLNLSPGLTEREFQGAIEGLAIRSGGVQAFIWAPWVSTGEREAFEARVQEEGVVGFRILEGDVTHPGTDQPVTAGARPAYLPVRYLGSQTSKDGLLGYDLLSLPSFAAYVLRAQDLGKILISPPMPVPYQGRVVDGFFAALPVYRPTLRPPTEEQRRAEFQGCVLAGFVFREVMNSLGSRTEDRMLDVMLVESPASGEERVLYVRQAGVSETLSETLSLAEMKRSRHVRQKAGLPEQSWDFYFRRGRNWSGLSRFWEPVALLLMGLGMTVTLSRRIAGAQRRAATIEQLVTERTAELEAANRRLVTEVEERQRIERHLQETQKLESLGLLAGGIAHDFNNLLTTAMGNVGLARMDLPAGSPVGSHLDQIETTTRRAADLCRQLLAYSGRGRFVIGCLDVNRLIRETHELIRLSVSKKVSVILELAASLPPVSGDATQLRQVLMNLVINAAEAIGERPGVVRLTTSVVTATRSMLAEATLGAELPEGEYVSVEVTDDGSGMEPETVAKIFDPFFTTKFLGRGLGLAAVLGITRSHRGAIRVDSQPGQGTTVRVWLPRAFDEADPGAVPGVPAPRFRGEGTLLVVDDEETVRIIASRILERAGFVVRQAVDGRDGVDQFAAEPDRFRGVVLDLTMPRLSGEEAFREIRRIRPGTPVLLMSGFTSEDAGQRFAGLGLNGFLEKPFGADQLLAAVQALFQPAPGPGSGPAFPPAGPPAGLG